MPDDLPLSDKLALVTGASGGIGSAVARRLARDGACVLVHYNESQSSAEALVREIEAAGGDAAMAGADLGHQDGPMTLLAQLDTMFGGRFAGRLDILVNNAGTFDFGQLTDATDESFDRLFNLNVRAVFQLSREAARRMTAAGWGRIITIGSVFGAAVPTSGLSIYCGTKFAVNGFTRAWSRDLGSAGITVNAVQPAVIQLEPHPIDGPTFDAMKRFTSVGRFGTPNEISDAVAFLASPNSAYINGASLTVDGGWNA